MDYFIVPSLYVSLVISIGLISVSSIIQEQVILIMFCVWMWLVKEILDSED